MQKREKLLLVAAILLILLALYLDFSLARTGDHEWELHAARKWLNGGRLYVDIFEVNFPLIFYIYAIPVYMSKKLGVLQDYQWMALTGVAAAFSSAAFCVYLLSRSGKPPYSGKQLVWQGLLLCYMLIEWVNPSYFFDREHIFLLLVFPYLLRNTPSLSCIRLPVPVTLLIGIMAGTGFCIKPYCAVVFAGVQLAVLVNQRRCKALYSFENIIICGIAAAYIALLYFHYPEYFAVVVPMAMAAYGAVGHQEIKLMGFLVALMMAALAFGEFRLRYSSPLRRDILYFSALLPFFLAYALSNNGWTYVWLPLDTMILWVTGLILMEFLYLRQNSTDIHAMRRISFGVNACALSIGANSAVVFFYLYLLSGSCGYYFECRMGRDFLASVKEINGGHYPRSFSSISGTMQLWTGLSRELNIPWDTRFLLLWMLHKPHLDKTFRERNQWIVGYIGTAYAEDLATYKPEILFVDLIEYLPYLKYSPAFGKEWGNYHFIGNIYQNNPKVEFREEKEDPQNKISFHGAPDVFYVYKRN